MLHHFRTTEQEHSERLTREGAGIYTDKQIRSQEQIEREFNRRNEMLATTERVNWIKHDPCRGAGCPGCDGLGRIEDMTAILVETNAEFTRIFNKLANLLESHCDSRSNPGAHGLAHKALVVMGRREERN